MTHLHREGSRSTHLRQEFPTASASRRLSDAPTSPALDGSAFGVAESEANLLRLGQHGRQAFSVGVGEAELLPERPRSSREQPGARCPGLRRLFECEHGEARAGTGRTTVGCHGDAPDQRVGAVPAQLEAGATDYCPRFSCSIQR